MFNWTAQGKEFHIRELSGEAELHAAEEIQREAWGFSDLDVVPTAQLIAAQWAGGVALGAFGDDSIVGFVYGFPGYEEGHVSIHSHMLAVRPQFRGIRAGLYLKIAQRQFTLEKGIDEITWTFDPLQSVNASLNFSRLGVISNRYIANFYGEATSSPLHQGFGTDRLWVSWKLTSEHVERRVSATVAGTARTEGPSQETPRLVGSEGKSPAPGDSRLCLSSRSCAIEIPGNITKLKEESPALANEWREVTRSAFSSAIEAGFIVKDFFRLSDEANSGGAYWLQRESHRVQKSPTI